jgi:hypothetical protein
MVSTMGCAADDWEEGLMMTTPLNLPGTSATTSRHTLKDHLSLLRTPNGAVVDLRRVDRGGGDASGCADTPGHGLPAVMDRRGSSLHRFLRHLTPAATTKAAVSARRGAMAGRRSRPLPAAGVYGAAGHPNRPAAAA